MAKQKNWAPEPLRAEKHTYLSGTKGYLIMGADSKDFLYTEELTPTIERLMACYNACAGVPTKLLVAGDDWCEAIRELLARKRHESWRIEIGSDGLCEEDNKKYNVPFDELPEESKRYYLRFAADQLHALERHARRKARENHKEAPDAE